jgi:hypothetical protein
MNRNSEKRVVRPFFRSLGPCLITLWALGSARTLSAQTPTFCSGADYRIATSTVLLIHCSEDVSQFSVSGQLFLADNPRPIDAQINVRPYPHARQWLLVEVLPGPSGAVFQQDQKYKLAMLPQPPVNQTTPTTVDIKMDNTIQVTPADATRTSSTFEFDSHVAFAQTPPNTCVLQVENFDRKTRDLQATCKTMVILNKGMSATQVLRGVRSPEEVGALFLTLDNDKTEQQLPYAIPHLTDIFGRQVSIDAKSQLPAGKAPGTKDAASYYINFSHAGARGSKPAWILNGKIAPPLGPLYHGFQFSPLLTADVGQNQITGMKYADTIDLGFRFNRIFEPGTLLQGLLLTPGSTYETDKEFDRHNLLATVDVRYNFKNLYNTRQRRTLRKFANEMDIANCKKNPPIPCTPIPWSLDNSKPSLYGYALDFHTGTEMGGSLIGTTIKASSGSATQALPTYHIVRIVPAVHALFELSRFSLDGVLTGRYLTTTENTAVEHPDHTLSLIALKAWKAYAVVTGTMNLDPAGHVAFTIAYKNGFSPPQFQRINAVQSGITFKY